jgi:hypothetical protein
MRMRGRALYLLGLCAACGSATDPPASTGPLTGTWIAQSINGGPLPFAFATIPPTKILIFADTLVLDGYGHYLEISHGSVTLSQTTPTFSKFTGPYAITDSVVVFREGETAYTDTGVLANGTLTVTRGEGSTQVLVYLYKKQ